ncbi:StsB family radical SAM/SPASM domain sactipeptide maturase [Micromonospora wenchangensis]|uniref:Radical SAM/SPASM domain-containing protein n=1 Tax=Micromonospora wenchangensis TaxID=1185415 RepID=A0A246RG88_9ACTN|nr:StsB family radical SAM/SPASM domain sactipeptide maturase [Micromonospora wenchangensis]OWV00244.1 radical SAM/SPASM domain-containing protein [Micromonospora wenchangensis]
MLVEALSVDCVPVDLVFFRDGGRNLVVNPELGAWQVLDDRELAVLRELASGVRASLQEVVEFREKVLARLVMGRLVYLPGRRPELRQVDAPLKLVYYAITDGCNLRCPYCYASSEKRLPGELGTGESLDLVEQIAALGAREVIFTGGEPMLRRDLFQVADRVRMLGMRASIITNATLIRKPEMARRVAETFSTITVSIDGGTAETHERTRGKGTFARTVAALRMLNRHGVQPKINHVVTEDNVDKLVDLGELFTDIDVAQVRLMHHSKLGRGRSDDSSFGWAEYKTAHRFVWTDPRAGNLLPDGPLGQRSCSIQVNCGIGGTEIYVNSLGDVYPCKLVTEREHKVGNVRRTSLRDLFANPLLADLRSNAVFAGDNLTDCRRCYIRGACGGGCRAYHMAQTGDLKRNSRALCRVLRHQMITSMWVAAGAGRETVLDNEDEAFRPISVATGDVHPVHEDWQAEAALLAAAPNTESESAAAVPGGPGSVREPTIEPAHRRLLPVTAVRSI